MFTPERATEDYLKNNPKEEELTEEQALEEEKLKGAVDFKKVNLEIKSPLETPEERVLETWETQDSRRLGGGINESFFVQLKDDGFGIFKPGAGEMPCLRKGVEKGTYFRRERAAYLVDRFLGFDLVPPTVIREIDGDQGSFQKYVRNSKTMSEFGREEIKSPEMQEQLAKLWIFDYIIYNLDRHKGNFLIRNGKVHAIDNGLSFAKGKLRRNYGKFWDIPVPDEVKRKFEKFFSWEEGQAILKSMLSELLSEEEAEACMGRIDKIGKFVKTGTIPSEAKKSLNF